MGTLLGAGATALGLWVLSGFAEPLPSRLAWPVVAAFAVACLLRDFGLVRFRLPENRRLVPEPVLRRPAGALQFGFEMGTGMRTFVPSSAPYVLAAALVLVRPGLVATLVAAVGFGCARAVLPWLRRASRDRDAWDRRIAASSAVLVRTGTVGVAIALGATSGLW